MTNVNLAIAGATGWTGSAIVDGALAAPDITLRSAVARSSAGQDLGTALGREPLGVPVLPTSPRRWTASTCSSSSPPHAPPSRSRSPRSSTASRRDRLQRPDRRRLRRDRRRGPRPPASARSRPATSASPPRWRWPAPSSPPAAPALGDHRLRQVDQARRPERHRQRARRAPAGRPRAAGRPAARRGRRPPRGARRRRSPAPRSTPSASRASSSRPSRLRAPDERLSIRHDAGGTAAPYVRACCWRSECPRPRRSRPRPRPPASGRTPTKKTADPRGTAGGRVRG